MHFVIIGGDGVQLLGGLRKALKQLLYFRISNKTTILIIGIKSILAMPKIGMILITLLSQCSQRVTHIPLRA